MTEINQFDFKKYDIGGTDATANDGRLTGSEVEKAEADGWTVWDEFREEDEAIQEDPNKSSLEKLLYGSSSMSNSRLYKEYCKRRDELFEQKLIEKGIPSSIINGHKVYNIDDVLFNPVWKEMKKEAEKQAKKELGLSENAFSNKYTKILQKIGNQIAKNLNPTQATDETSTSDNENNPPEVNNPPKVKNPTGSFNIDVAYKLYKFYERAEEIFIQTLKEKYDINTTRHSSNFFIFKDLYKSDYEAAVLQAEKELGYNPNKKSEITLIKTPENTPQEADNSAPKNAPMIIELDKYGEFDLNEIKSGIRKEDIKNVKMLQIFEKYDNGNGILEEAELSQLKNDIMEAAKEKGNENQLSKKESKHLLSGMKNVKLKDLVDFLNELKQLSANIQSCISNEDSIVTVIKDKDGMNITQNYDKDGNLLSTTREGTYNNNGDALKGDITIKNDGSVIFKRTIKSNFGGAMELSASIEYQFKNEDDFNNSKPYRIINGNIIEDITYQANGKIATSRISENNELRTESIYNEEGLIKEEKSYSGGKLSSRKVIDYSNGKIAKETDYDGDGKLTKCSLYENGLIKETRYYSNGELSSRKVIDYNNGKIEKESLYDGNGKLIESTQYENGKIKSKDFYEIKTHIEFDQNGKESYRVEYDDNGDPIQQIWSENGLETKRTERSQVKNEYHQGNVYNVTFTNDLITIEDCNTNKTKQIDLNILLKSFPEQEKNDMITCLKQLPGEVLMDLAIEVDTIIREQPGSDVMTTIYKNGAKFEAGGFYSGLEDNVHIACRNAEVITHELGHALSYTKNYVPDDDINLRKLFDTEMKNYLKDGNKRFKYNDPNAGCKTYATTNYDEMFAECYTLLTLGKCQSGEVIKKYFPRTLAYINDKINQIRNQKDSVRH